MQVERNQPAQGSEARRFTASRAAPRPAGKSFAAVLKQAATAPAASAPAPAPASPAASPAPSPQAPEAGGKDSAETPISFADHMELVRYRLKTGYYASKAIEDALTEKLSGYFDDLG